MKSFATCSCYRTSGTRSITEQLRTRIAWFRNAAPRGDDPFDDTARLLHELRPAYDIDVIVEADAHDFVWKHIQRPWTLCVFELDNTRSHEFMHAYALNYPGVSIVRSLNVKRLRELLFASRCLVVEHDMPAEWLRQKHPELHVRVAPPFGGSSDVQDADAAVARRTAPVTFAIFDRQTGTTSVAERAFQRAHAANTMFEIIEPNASPGDMARADVVVAPGWPPFHAPSSPIFAAMAAGRTVVTMERDATAEWPAVDPQTWRPRGIVSSGDPIAVTVDPRDEEHSLMLAIRRLAADAALREQLGAAARRWWAKNATPARAAAAWRAILDEAVSLSPPARPADWPTELTADGTSLARKILSEFGLTPPSRSPARS